MTSTSLGTYVPLKERALSTSPTTHDSHLFRLDLNLHHPFRDPSEFTDELAVKPWFTGKRGDSIAGISHKSTSWLCHFRKGEGNIAFDKALQDLVRFVAEHQASLLKIADEKGTGEVVLNATVPFDDGKILDLSLDPSLLKQLSQAHLQLRIQVWSKNEPTG